MARYGTQTPRAVAKGTPTTWLPAVARRRRRGRRVTPFPGRGARARLGSAVAAGRLRVHGRAASANRRLRRARQRLPLQDRPGTTLHERRRRHGRSGLASCPRSGTGRSDPDTSGGLSTGDQTLVGAVDGDKRQRLAQQAAPGMARFSCAKIIDDWERLCEQARSPTVGGSVFGSIDSNVA